MTVSTPRTAPAAKRGLVVGELANEFIRVIRLFNRERSRAMATGDGYIAKHILVRTVADEGPIRAGAIAELINSDPSTVSRQVAALVKDGLLERRADPVDGRASLLVTTDAAQQFLTERERFRNDRFAPLFADWQDDELAQFAAMLTRLADSLTAHVHDDAGADPGATLQTGDTH